MFRERFGWFRIDAEASGWKSWLPAVCRDFAGGAVTRWMYFLGKEHLEQMYFTFTAGFVWFRSAAVAPRAKSNLAGHVEGHFGLFPIYFSP